MNPSALKSKILRLKEAGKLAVCPGQLIVTPHGVRAFNVAVELAAAEALAELERQAAKLDSLLGAAKDSSRSLLQLVRDIRNLPVPEARAWVRADQQRLYKAIAEASKP